MASTDTFYEGQERTASSANPHLLRRLRGMIDEYHDLGVINFEMEAGTLFKMGAVYGFAAGAVVAIIAQRNEAEAPDVESIDAAVGNAIAVAIGAADAWSQEYRAPDDDVSRRRSRRPASGRGVEAVPHVDRGDRRRAGRRARLGRSAAWPRPTRRRAPGRAGRRAG